MKKTMFILATASVLVAASCAKESVSTPSVGNGPVTTFVGTPGSKITIGDKDDSVYPALWAKGDELSIVSEGGVVLGTATLVSGEGTNSGVFETTAEIVDGTKFTLVYGKKTVPTEQTQAQAGAKNLKDISYAESEKLTFASGSTTNFTLSHSVAIVKVTVSTEDFNTMSLKSVTLFSKGASLSTDTYGKDRDYVKVTFSSPTACTSAQEAWLTVKPGSGDYFAIAQFTGAYGGVADATVTIPVKFASKTLSANKVASVPMLNLTLASNSCPWYEPVETRYLADGCCYGLENTIPLINGGDPVTVNAKAHGDFVSAVEPKAVTVNFTYQHDAGNKYSNIKVNGEGLSGVAELFCKTTGYKVIKKFALDASYNFTVKSLDVSGWGAPGSLGKLILLDANDNPIWAFNLWNMKNPIKEFTTNNGYVLMDKNLGACSYEETTKSTRASAFFQWGRPFAFPWSGTFVDPMTTNAVSLKESAQNCYRMLKYSGAPFTTTDWYLGAAGKNLRTEHRDDLWGNANKTSSSWTTDGVKSIFDPCPKGWMVASPKALSEIEQNGVAFAAETDMFWIKYEKSKDEIAYFPYGGCKWGSDGGNPNDNKRDVCALWTNMSYSNDASTYSSYMVWWRCKGKLADNALQSASQGRATAGSVRCMKDSSNR